MPKIPPVLCLVPAFDDADPLPEVVCDDLVELVEILFGPLLDHGVDALGELLLERLALSSDVSLRRGLVLLGRRLGPAGRLLGRKLGRHLFRVFDRGALVVVSPIRGAMIID